MIWIKLESDAPGAGLISLQERGIECERKVDWEDSLISTEHIQLLDQKNLSFRKMAKRATPARQ